MPDTYWVQHEFILGKLPVTHLPGAEEIKFFESPTFQNTCDLQAFHKTIKNRTLQVVPFLKSQMLFEDSVTLYKIQITFRNPLLDDINKFRQKGSVPLCPAKINEIRRIYPVVQSNFWNC